jgi:DNA polymerase III delta subunit
VLFRSKLISYVGERKQVTVADVEALFSDSHEAAFFDMTNALRTADLGTCLKALDENLKIVEHPLQTLGAIAADFRKLIAARELLFTAFRSRWRPGIGWRQFQDMVKEVRAQNPDLLVKGKFQILSMKDYPLYLLLKDVQKFPLDKLLRIMESILEADIMFKSSRLGHLAPRAIMENLVMTICSTDAPAGKK